MDRVIQKEVKVNASIEKLWNAWTTTDGATRFFAPKARIELTPSGPYELYLISRLLKVRRAVRAAGC